MDASNINTIVALISAIIGGGLVKFIEVFVVARKGSQDYSAVIRDELRQSATSLQQEIRELDNKIVKLEQERDQWRDKYYSLVEKQIAEHGYLHELKDLNEP